MMTDIVLDTNIWIYAREKDSHHYHATQLILQNPNYNLLITSKNISEFFAVTSKVKIPFSLAFDFYNDLRNNVTILFPSENSLLIFETLLQKYHPKGNQIFDMEIISIMLAHSIKHIATFNKKDFEDISEIQMLEI